MDIWMILTKLILITYIGISYVYSPITNMPSLVFSLLLYLCINMAYYIVKMEKAKKIVSLLSILLSLVSYHEIQPLFMLLIPINLCEFIFLMKYQTWPLIFIASIPVLFLNNEMIPIYIFTAALSILIFKIVDLHTRRLIINENQLDKIRKDLDKLTKSLNDNYEYMKQSEYTFKLEERNRLSQAIHDNIGHSMTGALIQMEAAKRLMNIDKNKANELLQNAIGISKDGIENIRMILKQMKPQREQIGIHRLKLLLDEFSAKHDMKAPFLYEGNLEVITPIQWKVILENMTEALTNTLKYSQASQVSVEIHVLNKVIKVEVKDNGRGAEKITKGLGLMGMEERTASINGKIIVDGSNGFSVTTLLPIGP